VPPQSQHIHGWNTTQGCANTSHAVRVSALGREEETTRISRGVVWACMLP
jgi:hypothetical protein